MTDEEIEAVAEELAKIGGLSWYPGRTRGPLLRPVTERYKDRARVAIATLDRVRAARDRSGTVQAPGSGTPAAGQRATESEADPLRVGATVVYRPPGDQRAIACRIERLEEGRAYLVPCPRPDVGWVALDNLQPVNAASASKGE